MEPYDLCMAAELIYARAKCAKSLVLRALEEYPKAADDPIGFIDFKSRQSVSTPEDQFFSKIKLVAEFGKVSGFIRCTTEFSGVQRDVDHPAMDAMITWLNIAEKKTEFVIEQIAGHLGSPITIKELQPRSLLDSLTNTIDLSQSVSNKQPIPNDIFSLACETSHSEFEAYFPYQRIELGDSSDLEKYDEKLRQEILDAFRTKQPNKLPSNCFVTRKQFNGYFGFTSDVVGRALHSISKNIRDQEGTLLEPVDKELIELHRAIANSLKKKGRESLHCVSQLYALMRETGRLASLSKKAELMR